MIFLDFLGIFWIFWWFFGFFGDFLVIFWIFWWFFGFFSDFWDFFGFLGFFRIFGIFFGFLGFFRIFWIFLGGVRGFFWVNNPSLIWRRIIYNSLTDLYTNRCRASGIFNTLLFVVYLADVFIDIKNSINFNTSGCFGSPFLSLLYTLLQGGFTSSVNNNNNNNNNGRALFYFEEMSRYYRRDTKLGKKLFSYICLLKRKSSDGASAVALYPFSRGSLTRPNDGTNLSGIHALLHSTCTDSSVLLG